MLNTVLGNDVFRTICFYFFSRTIATNQIMPLPKKTKTEIHDGMLNSGLISANNSGHFRV